MTTLDDAIVIALVEAGLDPCPRCGRALDQPRIVFDVGHEARACQPDDGRILEP